MTDKQSLTQLIEICDVLDANIEKIQDDIQNTANTLIHKEKGLEDRLSNIILTLDGLGVDIDMLKEKIQRMI